MQPSRVAVRASRTVRVNTVRQNARRFTNTPRPQEQAGGSSSSSGPSHSTAIAAGAAGGAAVSILVGYAYYQYSGVGKLHQTYSQAKSYVDGTMDKMKVQLKEQTPDSNEALDTLRQTANKYAAFVPGGKQYVDQVFKDLEIVRKKHGDEVDKLVSDAYGELRDVSKKGMSLETASDTWNVLSKYLQELSSLAVDAGQDILNNHPELKNKIGGSFDQLKQYGDSLGPEAKKQVDETYQEIRDVIKQGFSWDTADRIRKITQEKVEQLKGLRDQAWKQGYEKLQPMLKDNPKIKETIEQNMDTLKNGNVTETLDKVKQAITSGDSGSLNEYIQKAKKKGEEFTSSSGGLSSWFQMIPGGAAIFPQLQKLQAIAKDKGPEAEKVAKETMDDIKSVLEKRSKQIEELYEKAKKE